MEDTSPGQWGFFSAVGAALVTQIGLYLSARRSAHKQAEQGSPPPIPPPPRDEPDNKDQRAFRYLVRRLDRCEELHKQCEDRNAELEGNFHKLRSDFAMSLFSIDILRRSMEAAGITVPRLPDIRPTNGSGK